MDAKDVKRAIVVLQQAQGELAAAIRQLEDGLVPGARFSIDDAIACLEVARKDLKKS